MVYLKKATMDDFEFFYRLKCEENNIFWTGHGEKPDKQNLMNFYERSVNSGGRLIYMIMVDDEMIGHIYIIPDKEAPDTFEFAMAISEKYQGKGYGKATVRLGLEEGKRLGYKKMIVSIREDNIASLKSFASCGVEVNDKYHSVFIPKLDKEVKMFYAEKDLI